MRESSAELGRGVSEESLLTLEIPRSSVHDNIC